MAEGDREQMQEVSRAFSALLEMRRLGHGRSHAVERVARLGGYSREDLTAAPVDAVATWTGCGDPLSSCELPREGKVLEIGCGAGLDLVLAKRRFGTPAQLYGIDMNRDMCDAARANLELAGFLDVTVHHATAEEIPLDDASADLVISNGMLALLPEKGRAITEAARVLGPAGVMVAAEVVLEKDLPPWMETNRSLASTGVGEALSLEEWKDVFRGSGFDRVEVVHRSVLEVSQLEDLIDRGVSGIEVAGCSASGAIMGIEAAALLHESVSIAVWKAST